MDGSAKPAGARIGVGPAREELERLAGMVGPAFYLLDLDRVRDNHAALIGALRRRYPRTVFGYSVKTNYTPRLLSLVKDMGGLAEVVSEMEFGIATRVGFPDERILVNGPLHEPAFLEHVFLRGIRINLDGWYMLDTLDRVRREHPERQFRVGLRLATPLPGVDWTRFGFATDRDGMAALAAWFKARPNCIPVGLHAHFPLAPPTVEMYRTRLQALAEAARTWFPDAPLEYLDVGGGFRRPPEGPEPAQVAEALAGVLEAAFPDEARPALVVEPGTAIVADAMAFACRVYDVKRAGGRTLALVNGSVHTINTMLWRRDFDVRVVPTDDRDPVAAGGQTFDVAGNTCMERKDLICEAVPGPVASGDYLVFEAVGSYSNALKPPFIHTAPAMVAREGGQCTVVKRRERVDDILRTYVL